MVVRGEGVDDRLKLAVHHEIQLMERQPDAMIGHSVGEFVAAVLSGVMRLEDAVPLVALRGKLMQELPRGSMLSVRLPEQELRP